MAAQLEVIVDPAVNGEKPLGLPGGFEPLHVPLAPSGRLMRDFAAIIQISALPMLAAELHLPLRCRVGFQLVRDHDPRRIAQSFQQFAEETLGRLRVAPALDQDVENNSVLVDGAPEIVLFAADADEDLVEEPLVARLGPTPLEGVGEVARTGGPTPGWSRN